MQTCFHSSHDEKMDIEIMSHPFNYEQHHRRKSRVSSRSSQKEIRDREQFYQSRSAEQFNEQQNFHQSHQIENLVKHEVISNYDEEDEKVEDEPAEDLRRKTSHVDK